MLTRKFESIGCGVCAERVFAGISYSLSPGWGGSTHAQILNSAAGCWSNCPGVVQYTPLIGVGGWPLIFTPRGTQPGATLGSEPASLPPVGIVYAFNFCSDQQRPPCFDESPPAAGAAFWRLVAGSAPCFELVLIFRAMTAFGSQANVLCHLPTFSSASCASP